jgi:hypothetical protein
MTFRKPNHVQDAVDQVYSEVKKAIEKLKDDIPNDGEIRRENWDIVYKNAVQQLTGFGTNHTNMEVKNRVLLRLQDNGNIDKWDSNTGDILYRRTAQNPSQP